MLRASWIGLFAVLTACGGDDGPGATADAAPVDNSVPAATIVYVVRHAETTGVGSDPSLSAAGQTRAQALATLLANADITAVYASQYARTQETGVPTATGHALQVTVQTAGASSTAYGMALANAAKTMHASHAVLIVGHSNTVPDTVKAFDPTAVISPISESEYNRLYTITIDANGTTVEATTY